MSPGSTVGYALQTSSTLSDIPCMPYLSEGPEVILPIELAAGQQLSAAVTLPAEDAQLYVLSDCSLPETCFEDAAIDATLGGEEEALLDWLPPAPGRYYLVVDIWSGLSDPLTAWEFELSIQVD